MCKDACGSLHTSYPIIILLKDPREAKKKRRKIRKKGRTCIQILESPWILSTIIVVFPHLNQTHIFIKTSLFHQL